LQLVSYWLALLFAGVTYKFTRKWSDYADINGISLSSDEQYNGGVDMTYQFNRHCDASMGYSYFNRDIDTDDLTNHAIFNILAFNVGYTYY